MPVAIKCVVAVGLLLCTIAIASAGNETNIANIVDMDKVAESANDVMSTPDVSNKVYLLLGIVLAAFLLSVAYAILSGATIANIAKRSGDNDQYSRGMDGMSTGAKTVIAVVILFAVVALFLRMM